MATRKTSAARATPAKKAPKSATKRAAAKATAPKRSPRAAANELRDEALSPQWAQEGDALTTAQGVRVSDTDNTLRVGSRGPALLEDFHLREKIMHFDHERIPERVVHARGAGAHGRFELYESHANITSAGFLNDPGRVTPVFVRFSTVAGSRGSADTVRDVRGFATKFYTSEGNFDLVGNNIPVFFIQDGMKFPDLVHAAKPEPDREIPQAQTAHDTFWDFVSLQPESTHMLMWAMSDRGIPRSYRMMEGFGVHTFRLVNARGRTSLVKFHWKPLAGIHGLVWDEAQKLGGIDPDYHRRDLWNSIEAGAFPQWELGLQVMPDTEDQLFEGIDLLDPTKIVPEELCPVQRVGRLTLDRNPANFFAETEQVAFHAGHVVPGIEVTDDPLIQARLFSYLDTQLTRLGGPNFSQIPINRPHAPVNDNLRDGFSQQAVHEGRTPYAPQSVGGGCPFASPGAGAYVHVPRQIEGSKVRERAKLGAKVVSFDDHYTQAAVFFRSLTEPEQLHLVTGFAFELGKVDSDEVVARMLGNLANVDATLAALVADQLGRRAPKGKPVGEVDLSPALSMAPEEPGPIDGRIIGVLASAGVDAKGIAAMERALTARGAVVQVVAPKGGTVAPGLEAQKTLLTAQPVEFDAIVVADGADALLSLTAAQALVQEVYRHHKPVAAWGSGVGWLEAVGVLLDAPGVVTAPKPNRTFNDSLCEAVGWHRFWERLV
jgi:catalase